MFNNNTILKNQERGVSLIMTFFILTIILAIVFSISILLYNGNKIIRNVGNSVVAFYAADSGVEKLLYYDRQITGGNKRGFCYMCAPENPNVCSNCDPSIKGDCQEPNCQDCHYEESASGGCNLETCGNCTVSFNSFFDSKKYELKATITPTGETFTTRIYSKGIYKDVSRKIQLQFTSD